MPFRVNESGNSLQDFNTVRTSLVYILKFIGAETQAELEVKGYQIISTLFGARF